MSSPPIVDVFVLAENRLLREALLRVFAKKNEIRVVGSNSYSPDIHEQIMATAPVIIVLDSSGLSHSSAQLISILRSTIPDVKLVMVDMDADEATFLRAIREGVVGYVLKDASAIELVTTIRSVAAGEAVCPSSLTATLFRYASRPPGTVSSIAWGAELGLSRREQQLMMLLRDGLTNKEIASELNISEQTVKNHVHNIMRKLGARDRLAAVRRCEVFRLEATGT
ncbi:MAG: response regulator transcription factor [Acidobacteriia bacterium]|nr:response regulator transcription factor [Terriglobia bacterium]